MKEYQNWEELTNIDKYVVLIEMKNNFRTRKSGLCE